MARRSRRASGTRHRQVVPAVQVFSKVRVDRSKFPKQNVVWGHPATSAHAGRCQAAEEKAGYCRVGR